MDLEARTMVRRWGRTVVSIVAGTPVALAGLLLTPFLLVPGLRRLPVRLTGLEVRRIGRFLGPVPVSALTVERCRRYVAARWLVGGLGLGVLLMFCVAVAVAVSMISAWAFDGSWGIVEDGDRVPTSLLLSALVPGAVFIFASAVGIFGVGTLDRWLAIRLLGVSPHEALQQRVVELTSTRAAVVEAVDDERRRIERDLHDGVQQRLVALGMLIGRARRSGGTGLLEQAQSMAQEAISELREVALRLYPSALDSAGLPAVLESLAERSSVPIRLSYSVDRLPPALETVIYFVVSEAVTNAAKHARPSLVEVSVAGQGDRVSVVITDDGAGGADASGTGLSGLARRVAAVDGAFSVVSPSGGPTVVEARLPCA